MLFRLFSTKLSLFWMFPSASWSFCSWYPSLFSLWTSCSHEGAAIFPFKFIFCELPYLIHILHFPFRTIHSFLTNCPCLYLFLWAFPYLLPFLSHFLFIFIFIFLHWFRFNFSFYYDFHDLNFPLSLQSFSFHSLHPFHFLLFPYFTFPLPSLSSHSFHLPTIPLHHSFFMIHPPLNLLHHHHPHHFLLLFLHLSLLPHHPHPHSPLRSILMNPHYPHFDWIFRNCPPPLPMTVIILISCLIFILPLRCRKKNRLHLTYFSQSWEILLRLSCQPFPGIPPTE